MQKRLEVIGLVVFVTGIGISGFSIATLFGAPPLIISDWRLTLGLGVGLGFLGMILYALRRELSFYWAEPNITLTTQVYEDYSNGQFYKNARLLVHNHEEVELTECFATLVYAADYYENDGREIPERRINGNRLRWSQSGLSDTRCELSIPPIDKREVNIAHTKRNFEYLLCDRTVGQNMMLASRLHIVEIRIDGKLNGKSIKPKPFKGYIFSQSAPYIARGVEHIQEIKDGEVTTHDIPREIHNSVEFMIFGEGVWKNDKEIKGAIEFARIEGEKWAEEYRKQQERNNEATKKWIKENNEQTAMKIEKMNKNPKKKKFSRKRTS